VRYEDTKGGQRGAEETQPWHREHRTGPDDGGLSSRQREDLGRRGDRGAPLAFRMDQRRGRVKRTALKQCCGTSTSRAAFDCPGCAGGAGDRGHLAFLARRRPAKAVAEYGHAARVPPASHDPLRPSGSPGQVHDYSDRPAGRMTARDHGPGLRTKPLRARSAGTSVPGSTAHALRAAARTRAVLYKPSGDLDRGGLPVEAAGCTRLGTNNLPDDRHVHEHLQAAPR